MHRFLSFYRVLPIALAGLILACGALHAQGQNGQQSRTPAFVPFMFLQGNTPGQGWIVFEDRDRNGFYDWATYHLGQDGTGSLPFPSPELLALMTTGQLPETIPQEESVADPFSSFFGDRADEHSADASVDPFQNGTLWGNHGTALTPQGQAPITPPQGNAPNTVPRGNVFGDDPIMNFFRNGPQAPADTATYFRWAPQPQPYNYRLTPPASPPDTTLYYHWAPQLQPYHYQITPPQGNFQTHAAPNQPGCCCNCSCCHRCQPNSGNQEYLNSAPWYQYRIDSSSGVQPTPWLWNYRIEQNNSMQRGYLLTPETNGMIFPTGGTAVTAPVEPATNAVIWNSPIDSELLIPFRQTDNGPSSSSCVALPRSVETKDTTTATPASPEAENATPEIK